MINGKTGVNLGNGEAKSSGTNGIKVFIHPAHEEPSTALGVHLVTLDSINLKYHT